MKILYSNVIELYASWGTEVFVNAALREQGHQTHCIDYKTYRRELAHQFLQAPASDVFLLQRGDGFSLRVLEAISIPRFFWASELVSRCRDQDRLFQSGFFDFVWVRGVTCRETLIERGWLPPEKCGLMLSGFNPAFHRPLGGVKRDIDVLFLGTLTPRRARIVESLARRFSVRAQAAFGEEMVQLFNRAKIVLNLHAEEFVDVETRIYEVLGCGAFLLSEPLARENPFSPQEVVQAENQNDLEEKIAYFLQHEDEREAIRKAGARAAWNGHTWGHRAAQLAQTMAQVAEQKTPAPAMLDAPKMRVEALRETPILAARSLKRFLTGWKPNA